MKFFNPFWTLCSVAVLVFATDGEASVQTIETYVGAVKTLEPGDITRVAIGQDAILGTTVLDNGELLLIPKAAGDTELHIWTRGERKHSYLVSILAADVHRQLTQLRSIFKSFVHVAFRHESGFIIAEGKVRPEDKDLFESHITKFPNVMSLVRPEQVEFKDMISMKVQVLEINKKYTKQLGIKWDSSIFGPSIGYVHNFKANGAFAYAREGNPFIDLFEGSPAAISLGSASAHSYAGIMTGISSMINLLKEDGNARMLAEPSLSTRSGEMASFQSGGQFPIAVLNQFGQPMIEMQDYGIQLDIEPVTDDDGNIISRVRAEMSSIDFATVVNGIPGILTRNTESVVNLRSGETMVISGLMKTEDSKAVSKLPLLGDIPIIGELFTSRNFIEGRTELIILVTPRIAGVLTELPESVTKQLSELQQLRSADSITDQLLN
ncbi:pilus assembly protein CpaC [Rheinheimera pacifica]|uniref:Pilus assembly protein CpaC n=1 Tax=Rheinheimera pacifica TaxID=173990 RepID=A0A1H6KZ14_9GAMM|nr:pilus assembly protein N-terminal domain-containing protein [Rheinheimera pacifica]SEH81093.1 pilus assembly protein CpaC [Rheinheimera pacifica]